MVPDDPALIQRRAAEAIQRHAVEVAKKVSPPEYSYRRLLAWSPTKPAWMVQVPELPGARATGATPNGAILDAQEAIRQWRSDTRALA